MRSTVLRDVIDQVRRVLLVAAILLLPAGFAVASEDDGVPPGKGAPPWQETSMGVEAARNSWSAYSTTTWAPFSPIDVDGFRLRTSGGYGRYRYEGFRDIGKAHIATEFGGITSFADLMIGYHLQVARTTIKAFAGGAGIAHVITPLDRNNEVSGLAIGFKATLETWTDLTEQLWLSADGSWTDAHGAYGSRMRGGWRMLPELSLGVEAGLHGNVASNGGRSGLFIRYAPDWGEVSISGGMMRDLERQDGDPDRDSLYGSLNVLLRY